MKYSQLGNAGLRVSRVCLGMLTFGDPKWRNWILDLDAAEPLVRRAADRGINFFDTADVYSDGASEQVTGQLLRSIYTRRDEYVLATKVFNRTGKGPNDYGLSRAHIMSAVDASLRRLKVDHIDLYQVHKYDPATPALETMQALNDLIRVGKVRYIGASNMYAWQFAKYQRVAEVHGLTGFISLQSHYNLLYREEEREIIPQCMDMGVGVLPWSPLARGTLARPDAAGIRSTTRAVDDESISTFYSDASREVLARLARMSKERDTPPAQLALAWLMKQPGVTAPVFGATKLAHIDDATAAVDVELSSSEVATLCEAYEARPILGYSVKTPMN